MSQMTIDTPAASLPAQSRTWAVVGRPRDGNAVAVLQWSDTAVNCVREYLPELIDSRPVPPHVVVGLRALKLLKEDGCLTPFGRRLGDLLIRERWQQADDQLRTFFAGAGLGPSDRLLDIGCSTGATLRFLGPDVATKRVGVDVDEFTLAVGTRLARAEGRPVDLRRGSAHALPLSDRSVACVICRNVLTYTHQRTTLEEISRVLRPGAWFFIRVENLWYDLQPHRHLNWRPRQVAGRVRDFGTGLARAVLGWQSAKGNGWRGGRTFAAWRRVRADLRRLGCEVTRVEGARNCPRLLGFPTQTVLIGRKQF